MAADQRDAITTLLDVYEQRLDLRQAYPEASSGNYFRLVQWAWGVCMKDWADPSYSTLIRHLKWYSPEYNLHLREDVNPAAAFETWDQPAESLEAAEKRIHDGVPLGMLGERANRYVEALSLHFPWAMPGPGSIIVEIGSGVGYIMESVHRRFRPASILGLDVAPAMAVKGRQRLERDRVIMPAQFVIYDGLRIPLMSASVDFLYSVACFQHIPKPYVYNLFGEILRILKPARFATLHLLSFSALRLWKDFDLRRETANQLLGVKTHWHHFYSVEELSSVLENGYGADRVTVVDTQDGSIWVTFTSRG